MVLVQVSVEHLKVRLGLVRVYIVILIVNEATRFIAQVHVVSVLHEVAPVIWTLLHFHEVRTLLPVSCAVLLLLLVCIRGPSIFGRKLLNEVGVDRLGHF